MHEDLRYNESKFEEILRQQESEYEKEIQSIKDQYKQKLDEEQQNTSIQEVNLIAMKNKADSLKLKLQEIKAESQSRGNSVLYMDCDCAMTLQV